MSQHVPYIESPQYTAISITTWTPLARRKCYLHSNTGVMTGISAVCINMSLCLCIGVLVYWCIGVLVYWCIGVLVYWCIGVLVYWCIGVLVYWCIGVLVYWCIGVLVYWCIGVLVYWCIGVLSNTSRPWTPRPERSLLLNTHTS